jgi:hypothetical protein
VQLPREPPWANPKPLHHLAAFSLLGRTGPTSHTLSIYLPRIWNLSLCTLHREFPGNCSSPRAPCRPQSPRPIYRKLIVLKSRIASPGRPILFPPLVASNETNSQPARAPCGGSSEQASAVLPRRKRNLGCIVKGPCLERLE